MAEVFEAWLATLEASALSREVRQSVWLYPAANVGHIIGLMLFFASVAAMDVKALFGNNTIGELRNFDERVRPFALVALAIQVMTGVLMFLPEATHIAHNLAFQIKIIAIILALSNALMFSWFLRPLEKETAIPQGLVIMSALSLALWIGVAALGRLIAYA